MSSFASRFKAGSDIAKDLLNTYETAKRKKEMGEIAGAQEQADFTPEERAAMEAKANAVDDNGQPIYTMGTDAQGNVTTTLNKEAVPGAVDEAYAPAAMARSGVNFLGKTYGAPLTDGQRLGAQQQAMAGVLDKNGDIEGAMRYRQQAKQGELTDMQLAQAVRTGKREDKADEIAAILEGVDKEAGAWMKTRLIGADGTERTATVDDHLATTQFRANKLMEAGRATEAGALIKDFNAQSLVKIQLETAQRSDALKKTSAALAAGDLNAVKDFYNKFTPDGAQVVSVSRDDKGQILIERTTDDGRPMAPHTLKDTGELSAALKMFEDPMALYNWTQSEFTRNLQTKADKRADVSLDLQRQTTGATLGARADAKKASEAAAAAGVALYKEQHPNATPAELDAVKQGVLSAVPKVDANAPAEVKLAKAFKDAGIAKTDEEALRMATQSKSDSPAKVRAEVYGKALAANFGNADKAKEATEAAMSYLFPAAPAAAAGTIAPGATFANQTEFDAAVKAGKVKSGDRVSVGGRSATYK
jgi:hypothetical protein